MWSRCLLQYVIKGHITCLEIDPSTDAFDDVLPFLGISHHDATTFFIVVSYTHFHDVITSLDICIVSCEAYIVLGHFVSLG